MWLIDAETLQLKNVPSHRHGDFPGHAGSRPKYSILSHRWQDGEVSFQDMQDHNLRKRMPGFQKIVQACRQSLKDGIKYTWVDTCCINKRNATEESEAINMMYRWYQEAEVCYAFLFDITNPRTFSSSQWFSRGWCLQELVAPRRVHFFNSAWSYIGDKQTLQKAISQSTNIDVDLLAGRRSIESFSIAQRMSWASRRITKVAEDRAYCLLGIFQVKLALNYGEGIDRAFRRLQQEIIRHSDDHSIFAWSLSLDPGNHGFLARSPAAFATSSDVRLALHSNGRSICIISDNVISMTLPMAPWGMDTYLAVLNCSRDTRQSKKEQQNARMGVYLRRLPEDGSFIRLQVEGEDLISNVEGKLAAAARQGSTTFRNMSVNIRQAKLLQRGPVYLQQNICGFRFSERLVGRGLKPTEVADLTKGPGTTYNRETRTILKAHGSSDDGFLATLDLTGRKSRISLIKFFIDRESNPICFLADSSAIEAARRSEGRSTASRHRLDGRESEVEIEASKPFHARKIDDRYGWNKMSSSSGQVRAYANDLRKGLWMLKGSRTAGLDVVLEGTASDEKAWGARLTIQRGASPQGEVWDVDIEGLAGAMSSGSGIRRLFR